MESLPQNPEFRNNPENFHPCYQEGIFTYRIQICLIIDNQTAGVLRGLKSPKGFLVTLN